MSGSNIPGAPRRLQNYILSGRDRKEEIQRFQKFFKIKSNKIVQQLVGDKYFDNNINILLKIIVVFYKIPSIFFRKPGPISLGWRAACRDGQGLVVFDCE